MSLTIMDITVVTKNHKRDTLVVAMVVCPCWCWCCLWWWRSCCCCWYNYGLLVCGLSSNIMGLIASHWRHSRLRRMWSRSPWTGRLLPASALPFRLCFGQLHSLKPAQTRIASPGCSATSDQAICLAERFLPFY